MYNSLKVFCIWAYFQLIGVWKILQEQIWDRHRGFETTNIPSMVGKTIVITGGNRGIGFEAVKKLLVSGCHIIIGCRRPTEALEKIEQFVKEKDTKMNLIPDRPLGTFECVELNVASMKSVKTFASKIIQRERDVHTLINNAGIMFGPFETTEEGLENQMATNYFGHFLLTSSLLPLLISSADKFQSHARIVNVASCAHFAGSWLNLDDLNSENYYSACQTYANTKAAQIMFAKCLQNKLYRQGLTHIDVNCIHPGVVNTGLFQHVGWAKWFSCLPWIFFKTPKQGGDAVVYAAVSPEIEGQGNLYLDNMRSARSSSFVNGFRNQTILWQKTCDILQITDFGSLSSYK